jgi:hypothetical protein
MKRMLLVLSAAVLFLSTLAVPNVALADGGSSSTNCGQTLCKP